MRCNDSSCRIRISGRAGELPSSKRALTSRQLGLFRLCSRRRLILGQQILDARHLGLERALLVGSCADSDVGRDAWLSQTWSVDIEWVEASRMKQRTRAELPSSRTALSQAEGDSHIPSRALPCGTPQLPCTPRQIHPGHQCRLHRYILVSAGGSFSAEELTAMQLIAEPALLNHSLTLCDVFGNPHRIAGHGHKAEVGDLHARRGSAWEAASRAGAGGER